MDTPLHPHEPRAATSGNPAEPDLAGSEGTDPWDPFRFSAAETWLAPAYFGLYLSYLFWHQEGEIFHWVTLVLLPLGLVLLLNRGRRDPFSSALASLGLRRGNLRTGLGVTLLLGAAVGAVQVFLSRSGPAFLEAVADGSALWRLPLAFVLLLFLTGLTEEFFFRGFLQTRVEALVRSKLWGLVVTTFLFGLYHLPYAYFNPMWPSAGDWGAALGAALGDGMLGGLVLGGLFLYTRKNLLMCIVLHALVDAFPAMTMIRFGGG